MDSPKLMLTVRQGIAISKQVSRGAYASEVEAIAASLEDFQATTLDGDLYSAAAITTLRAGLEQLDRGEYVTAEEVDAKFEKWLVKRSERADNQSPEGK